ncbi:MAG: CheR family methyltransferase [Thermodesulfobacteriota bacterium]
MKSLISDIPLSQISDLVTARTGLRFPRERWDDLQRGIEAAAKEFGFDNAESCVHWLLSSSLTRDKIETLASHLTVGETYFFREEKGFRVLEEDILPELIASRRGGDQRLRIWSAGCATGEEPYSIAILLGKISIDLNNWNTAILATDINPRFLQKASHGIYGEWSFRGCPQWVKEKYFKKTKDGRFEIARGIKKMVIFFHHNLAEDPYPSLLNKTNAMDVIFCRNVLMYFAPEQANKVIQGFYDCLTNGGWLIVSPSEASHVLYPQFTAVNYLGVILYRKEVASGKFRIESYRFQDVTFKLPIPSDKVQVTGYEREDTPRPLIPEPQPTIHYPRPPTPATYEEALSLYGQGYYAEAEEKVIDLLSHDGADSKAMALLARVYANQGKLSDALDYCRKAITTDRLNPGYYYLLATILQEQNQVDEAAVSLKQALYLEQDFALAHFALGNLTLQQRKLQEARKHFENALSLLDSYQQEDVLPESEGMTAGRLMEIITAIKLQFAGCKMQVRT